MKRFHSFLALACVGVLGLAACETSDALSPDADIDPEFAWVNAPGGGGSYWILTDEYTTSNGLPAGGYCTWGPAGIGASIVDGQTAGQGDAYDFASMLWVDNTLVGGNLSMVGNTGTFSAVSISGLTVQTQYHLVSTSATARNYTSFTNPTGNDITVTVDFVTNFGSDGSTQITGSSSGDLAFGTDDRWVVTDDYSTTYGDPANTTVFYGPDSPKVTPASVSQTVFNCAGTEGLRATYSMTVPAGVTQALMFFHQMNNTSTNGVSAATLFDVTPVPGDDLVTGLTAAQINQAVNWRGNPQTKDDCKDGGWEQYGFKNQGQCVRFIETGKDSR